MVRTLSRMLLSAALLIALIPAAHASAADSRDFKVYNKGDHTIVTLNVSKHSHNTWEEDVLGDDDVIAPGDARTIRFHDDDDSCMYDVRAVYSDSTKRVISDVNICTDNVSFYY